MIRTFLFWLAFRAPAWLAPWITGLALRRRPHEKKADHEE
jgi:hypothetical protein